MLPPCRKTTQQHDPKACKHCAGNDIAWKVNLQVQPRDEDRNDQGEKDDNFDPARRPSRVQRPGQCESGDLHGIPHYSALFRAGRLPVDKLITHRLTLDQINEGFERLACGEAVRQVILFG